ncbi:bifunctional SulP family inorganic anion transporter/carbonic anhydrase [Mycobacterium sp. SMC-4]|uniref:bifunctional SulP family inorganic anion transporter/carbonic anhydrase n=1 Tax=Mycobacterium sp. SMC-4 TaxID=2857059 RepID=UPI0021B2909F|nr:bifunctional SulP family inorganic anion transporter/carbonic anhydrase [Mycobacterium sp. SMC-4]
MKGRLGPIVRHDLPASIVVFLVALPLSIGIAVASNAPVLAGIIAAIVGGIVVGVLGGSPLQVSGPAAGLTVIVASLIDQFGWAVTCAITVAAGVLQVLLGLSRTARAALAVSPVVVHAMLAGIGVTIALQQVHVLLGGDSHGSGWENLSGLPEQVLGAHLPGLLMGLLVIVVMVGWRWVPAPINTVPGPLAGIVAATALSVVVPWSVPRIELDGSIVDAIQLPALPDGNWGAIAVGVLTVALIASVESLLCAVAVDRMKSGHRTNFDRELLGQGAGNITSGMIGGLPITGVIVRSSANVRAGAETRASGIMHGYWVLAFALPFAWLAELIPTAALAGLLIVVGAQLVKKTQIQTALRTGDIAVYAVTILGVVFINLLQGVLIGLALAVALVVWRVARARIKAERVDDDSWQVSVEGSCTFLSLPRLTRVLNSLPPENKVSVELSIDFIDHAALEAIEDWTRQYRATGGTVEIDELGPTELQSAADGPPARRFGAIDKRAGVFPWSAWRQHHFPSVLQGLDIYHRSTAPYIRPHMEQLANAQRPETLFITCTDSRIVPNVITSSGPGDLFTVRNVGNLVPPEQRDPSVEAAITFAVSKLRVSSIVICGHSSCGAMNALLSDGAKRDAGDEHLYAWLAHGRSTVAAFQDGRHPVARSAADAGFGRVDQLSMVHVAVQIETLREHPLIAEAYQEGKLDIIGLFYDITSAAAVRVSPTEINGHIEAHHHS